MVKEIRAERDIIPTFGFCPGSGVTSILVSEACCYDDGWFEDRICRSVPVGESYGRPSPYLCTSQDRNYVYSYIGLEVKLMYEGWNRHNHRKLQHPIVTRQWVDEWFDRMGIDKMDCLSRLGVLQMGDTISLGETDRGGRRITIKTDETQNGFWLEQKTTRKGFDTSDRKQLLDVLTDISVLTALADLNRIMTYYAISDACGWKREMTPRNRVTTHNQGISIFWWEVLDGEVHEPDGAPYLLPLDGDSWAVCQAMKGDGNQPVTWQMLRSDRPDLFIKRRGSLRTRIGMAARATINAWERLGR